VDNATNEQKARVTEAFRNAGLRVRIGGCGCCGSPWVQVQIVETGEFVTGTSDPFGIDKCDIDMFGVDDMFNKGE